MVLDYPKLAEGLDFVSWDNYPVESTDSLMIKASLCGDIMRGIKGRNYWIMEQATGMISVMWEGMEWEQYRNVYQGELRKMALQQIAHGADGLLWFRWRAAVTGREQYLGGVLGHDGKPSRRFQDIVQASIDIRKIQECLSGTTVKAEVAVLFDYESNWAHYFTPVYKQNNYFERVLVWYRALFNAGVNVDMVRPDADLSAYKVVLAPHLVILRDKDAHAIDSYVKNGGFFLADCRTGEKDEYNRVHERTLPGLLSSCLGIEITDYSCMYQDMHYAVKGDIPGDYSCYQYCEWVRPVTAVPVATYDCWQMEGAVAATSNAYGKGRSWYIGAVIEQQEFYDTFMINVLNTAGVHPPVNPQPGLEIVVRENIQHKILFLLNHNEKKISVAVPKGKTNLLTGKTTTGKHTIERYGVAVIQLSG
jgi:beta-galactosidase